MCAKMKIINFVTHSTSSSSLFDLPEQSEAACVYSYNFFRSISLYTATNNIFSQAKITQTLSTFIKRLETQTVHCGFRDGPLEKLWGGGGGVGNFRAAGTFFVIKFLAWIFFRPQHEYFLGLIGVHDFFFHLIFPCANIYFFVLRAPPPPISFLMVRPLRKLCGIRYYMCEQEPTFASMHNWQIFPA